MTEHHTGRICLQLTFQGTEAEALIRYAILHGFARERERKAWSRADRRQAIQFAVTTMAQREPAS